MPDEGLAIGRFLMDVSEMVTDSYFYNIVGVAEGLDIDPFSITLPPQQGLVRHYR